MSGEIESQPEEIRETSEATENTEQQSLEDATLEPQALVEQSGDFRQAEDVQQAFTGTMENAGVLAVPELQMLDGIFKQVGEEVTPIPLAGEGTGATPFPMPEQRLPGGEVPYPPPLPDHSPMEPETGAAPENESESEEQASGIIMDASVLPFTPENQESEGGSLVEPASVLEASVINLEEGADPDMFEGLLVEEAVVLEEGLGEAEEGWIPITGMYVHVAQDGTKTVVDANGKPVDSPPLYTMIVNEKGEEIFMARYPTGAGQTEIKGILTTYSAPITGMYVHAGQDGITVVDANGKQVDSPPMIVKVASDKGGVDYLASYPDGEHAVLTAYSAPITGLYVHAGQDGITVVDANGKQVDSPPTIVKVASEKGGVDYLASYPDGEHAVLTTYSAPITGMYVHAGQDGITVVDANGKQVDSPPTIVKVASDKGGVDYLASYPDGEHAVLTTYSAPITGMYIHIGQDGNATVVDANGEPVDSPPLLTKIANSKSGVIYLASYPGSQGSALEYYKPASAKPASGTN